MPELPGHEPPPQGDKELRGHRSPEEGKAHIAPHPLIEGHVQERPPPPPPPPEPIPGVENIGQPTPPPTDSSDD